MSANAGGVRNLRAMFENKTSDQSTSPPSRGRSPSGSVASASSRPVSKVRTSFVAVERPGDLAQGPQWGLRKASDVSSMAEVKEDRAHLLGSLDGRGEKAQAPKSPHTTEHSMDGGLGSILKGSAFEGTPSKGTAVELKVNGDSQKAESKPNGVASRAAAMVEKMKTNHNPQPPPATTLKTTPTAHPVKPPHPKHIPATQSPSSPKPNPPKTPTSPVATKMNIRGGPAKIRGVMESAKKAGESRETMRKEQAAKSPVTSKPQPSPKTSAPTVPPAVTATTATSHGHKTSSEQPQKAPRKPRPSAVSAKLPSAATAPNAASDAHKTEETKPAQKTRTSAVFGRLPSAVTAKTTASAAKTDKEPATAAMKQRQSRSSMASGGRPAKIPSAATAGTASTLAKKSSRTSLANGERPRSRLSSAKPDESFLARMARPTVSSASKTHDKAEVPKTKAASRHARKSDQSHTTTSDEPVAEGAGVASAIEHPNAEGLQEDRVPLQAELAEVQPNSSLPTSNPTTVGSNA